MKRIAFSLIIAGLAIFALSVTPAGAANERDIRQQLKDMFNTFVLEVLADLDPDLCSGVGPFHLESNNGTWTCATPADAADFLPLAGGTLTGEVVFDDVLSKGATLNVFTNGDVTPDVTGGNRFRSGTVAVTMTDFDGTTAVGHSITIQSNAANTIFECGIASPLFCGYPNDLVTNTNDVTEWTKNSVGVWILTSYVQGVFGPNRPRFTHVTMPESAAVGDPGPGFGRYWVDSGLIPNRPRFTDENDLTHLLAYGEADFRECQRSITTEQAGDVLMCSKGQGDVTLRNLTCVALGSVVPVAQIVEVVECAANGSTCVGSGLEITAIALEVNYDDSVGTDIDVDIGDWWGIKLTSFTTASDFLHCQVEYDEQ